MGELNVVEGIQEVSPELQVYSLGKVEVLQQAQVGVGVSRTNGGALGAGNYRKFLSLAREYPAALMYW